MDMRTNFFIEDLKESAKNKGFDLSDLQLGEIFICYGCKFRFSKNKRFCQDGDLLIYSGWDDWCYEQGPFRPECIDQVDFDSIIIAKEDGSLIEKLIEEGKVEKEPDLLTLIYALRNKHGLDSSWIKVGTIFKDSRGEKYRIFEDGTLGHFDYEDEVNCWCFMNTLEESINLFLDECLEEAS